MTGSLRMHYISVSAKSGDLVVFSIHVYLASHFRQRSPGLDQKG